MATTPNVGIVYPVVGNTITPLATHFANLATSADTAIVAANPRGTTAQRDSRYPLPATDPARVALANQAPVWFNTEKGWYEGYFATTGIAGLTAKGLLTGHASGWYPLAGSGLRAHRGKTNGFQALSAATNTDPVLASMDVNMGGFSDNGNSGINVPYGGYYRVHGSIYYTGAASNYVGSFLFRGGALVASGRNYKSTADIEANATETFVVTPSQVVALVGVSEAGSVSMYGTTGYNGARMTVEYVGPPLVNG